MSCRSSRDGSAQSSKVKSSSARLRLSAGNTTSTRHLSRCSLSMFKASLPIPSPDMSVPIYNGQVDMYPCATKVRNLLDGRCARHVTTRRQVAGSVSASYLLSSRLTKLRASCWDNHNWEVGKLWASRWGNYSVSDKALSEWLV
jgi:hypothetical protein